MTETLDRRRAQDDLLRHCHALADAGLVTAAAGNASARVGPQVLLTASGARFGELTSDDLVLVDTEGVALDGGRPSSELLLHLEVYRRRPDISAVIHTHGRHAVALSTVSDQVPALHYYCLDLGGPVPVAAYRTFGTSDLARVTVDALGQRAGVVMAHHGSLTTGHDVAAARARAELLEWLCEVALLALAAGRPTQLDDRALADVRAQIRERNQR